MMKTVNINSKKTNKKQASPSQLTLSCALDTIGHRLGEINQRWPSLEAAGRPISMQQCAFAKIRDHVDSAIEPATTILRVFDTTHELQNLHMPDLCSDLFDYL